MNHQTLEQVFNGLVSKGHSKVTAVKMTEKISNIITRCQEQGEPDEEYKTAMDMVQYALN
jgi:hypothetical protein